MSCSEFRLLGGIKKKFGDHQKNISDWIRVVEIVSEGFENHPWSIHLFQRTHWSHCAIGICVNAESKVVRLSLTCMKSDSQQHCDAFVFFPL
jgi:hypothetical protein